MRSSDDEQGMNKLRPWNYNVDVSCEVEHTCQHVLENDVYC